MKKKETFEKNKNSNQMLSQAITINSIGIMMVVMPKVYAFRQSHWHVNACKIMF
jgi:hypothetical protein